MKCEWQEERISLLNTSGICWENAIGCWSPDARHSVGGCVMGM